MKVSVPGKFILMGEHAVVYGRPALVAAVDLRLRAAVADADGGVRIELPQLGVTEETDWSSVLEHTDHARELWRGFASVPSEENFERMRRDDDPCHLVKIALGEAARECGGDSPAPVAVEVVSEIPVGSGFGSSAATSVAVLAAYLGHRGRAPDTEMLDRLALDVERRQHGLPSGVDHATVLHGGLVWARKDEHGRMDLERLEPVGDLLDRIHVYDSGAPAEPTGAVVAAVHDRLERDGGGEATLDRMEQATTAFRDRVTSGEDDPPATVELIREYERCLESLGVVPDPVRDVIRQVEQAGGAAKVSGAGALSGEGAGGVMVYHPEPERLGHEEGLSRFRLHPVRLGAPGLRRETRE